MTRRDEVLKLVRERLREMDRQQPRISEVPLKIDELIENAAEAIYIVERSIGLYGSPNA